MTSKEVSHSPARSPLPYKTSEVLSHGVEDGVEWAVASAPLYGALNGYVNVPEGHPWYGLGYDAIPQSPDEGPTYITVHGGLTAASANGVIGFDTLHAGDYWPGMEDRFYDSNHRIEWTHEMVAEEARNLARQVAAATHAVMRYPLLSVDLDSTLADTRHRRGIIEQFKERGEEVDWAVYANACAQDEPTGFAAMLVLIQDVVPWVVVSGRSEGSREATEAWLAQHGLKPEAVYLEDSSERHTRLGHSSWKAARTLEVADKHPTIKIHVDDWAQVADLLQRSGRVTGVTVVPPGMVPMMADNPDKALTAL